MNFKKTLVLSIMALTGMALVADEPVFVKEGDHGFIKIGANFALCGSITFTPKKFGTDGTIKLFSYRYDGSGKKIADLGTATIDQTGLTQEYQWAGFGDTHFRVYAKIEEVVTDFSGTRKIIKVVDPKEYLDISFRHNLGCIVGPAGPNAPKEPLNLIGQ